MTTISEPRRILVAGAGAAGLAVAETARASGFAGELLILGRERHIPYDRPPLSKQILSGTWEPDKTLLRQQGHLDELGITVRISASITALDEDAQEVVLADGERVWYDSLAITTGVNPRRLPGTENLSGVHVLRDLDHATALRDELIPGRSLVVIGAGVLGSEVAAVAATLGLSVTVVDPLPLPMARVVGTEIGQLVVELHHEHGVRLIPGVGVAGFEDLDGQVTAVQLTDGRSIAADAVLVAVGSTPSTEWLRNGSVRIGGPTPHEGSGGILCSESGVAAPRIYAAGDVAAWWNPITERYDRVEHRLNAAEQGRLVAKTIITPDLPIPRTVPYFWSDQYGLKLQSFGSFDPQDQFLVVRGSLSERKFVGVYIQDDKITAVSGMGLHRDIRTWSAEIGKPMPQHQ